MPSDPATLHTELPQNFNSETSLAAADSWRDSVRIHPAADRIPEASEDEKRALAADLARHGQRQPIILVQVGARPKQVLDGRTRLDLLAAAGVDVVDGNGKVLVAHRVIQVADDAEAEQLSLSLNFHRRHLSAEQKRELIAQQLKATPEKSNRQIAKTAKVDDKTVGAVRRELESTAEIPQLGKTLGADNKVRPSKRKSGAAKSAKPKPSDASAALKPSHDIGTSSASETEHLRAQIDELQLEQIPIIWTRSRHV